MIQILRRWEGHGWWYRQVPLVTKRPQQVILSKRHSGVFLSLFVRSDELRQEPYRFSNTVWWGRSSLCWPRLLKYGRTFNEKKKPHVVQKVTVSGGDGRLLNGVSSDRLRDPGPSQLLPPCLSQALQRVGLWLKLSIRGDEQETVERRRGGDRQGKSVLVSSTLSSATEKLSPIRLLNLSVKSLRLQRLVLK